MHGEDTKPPIARINEGSTDLLDESTFPYATFPKHGYCPLVHRRYSG
jgi:hypothetical protein